MLRILKGYVLSPSGQIVNIQKTIKPIHSYIQAVLILCKIFLIYYNLTANQIVIGFILTAFILNIIILFLLTIKTSVRYNITYGFVHS
jgi:hypothetical protein